MINTHDELEREPLTLGTFTEYVTNQLGSPSEAESGPADVCEWAATFVTEAPSLVEKEITPPDLVFATLLQTNSPQIPDSFDLLVPLSPTHGVANNVERYSVKPGPHVRASRPPTQSVASKWPIPPTYPLRSCDTATSVSWNVAACPVHSDGVVVLPSYHDRSCPPVCRPMKIMSTRAVPRPTVTGATKNCCVSDQLRHHPTATSTALSRHAF